MEKSKELHIKGWLCYDDDGLISVKDKRRYDKWCAYSIQKEIEDFMLNRVDYYEDSSLGGERIEIPNVSMRMYVTNRESTLDEAIEAMVLNLYGDIRSDIAYEGYSEWTITGYNCAEFSIGGHDLAKELDSYIGKYIHLIIECREELDDGRH